MNNKILFCGLVAIFVIIVSSCGGGSSGSNSNTTVISTPPYAYISSTSGLWLYHESSDGTLSPITQLLQNTTTYNTGSCIFFNNNLAYSVGEKDISNNTIFQYNVTSDGTLINSLAVITLSPPETFNNIIGFYQNNLYTNHWQNVPFGNNQHHSSPAVWQYQLSTNNLANYIESYPALEVTNQSLTFLNNVTFIAGFEASGADYRPVTQINIESNGILLFESQQISINPNDQPIVVKSPTINNSYLYFPDQAGLTIWLYTIDPISYQATYTGYQVPEPTGIDGWIPRSIVFYNNYAYVTAYDLTETQTSLYQYAVDNSNGHLTYIGSAPTPPGISSWDPECISFYDPR